MDRSVRMTLLLAQERRFGGFANTDMNGKPRYLVGPTVQAVPSVGIPDYSRDLCNLLLA